MLYCSRIGVMSIQLIGFSLGALLTLYSGRSSCHEPPDKRFVEANPALMDFPFLANWQSPHQMLAADRQLVRLMTFSWREARDWIV